jgi:hypothetical protein
MPNEAKNPRSRKDDLVVREQGDETSIYDTKNHHAHCLNRLAALIWRNCDGRRTLAELAALAHQQLDVPDDVRFVELALVELEQANLLEGRPPTTGSPGASRRELARRLLGAGAAAFLLTPLVTSIRTQSALAA